MLIGHVDRVSRNYLQGWAADAEDPAARVELTVFIDGIEVGRVRADRLRQEFRDRGLHGDGCHNFIFHLEQPLSLLRSHRLTVRFSQTNRVLHDTTIRPDLVRADASPAAVPVLLTASGRSGTSVVMQALAGDPAIVVAGDFPYEVKLLLYYTQAFEILTAPGDHKKSIDPNIIYKHPYSLGLNPFHHQTFERVFPRMGQLYEFFQEKVPPKIAATFGTIVAEFYLEVASGQGKGTARLFAEKCDIYSPVRLFSRLAFERVRELVLVRDPRDMYLSYQAFWSSDPAGTLQILKSFRNQMLDVARDSEARVGDDAVLFVRYEDFVQKMAETLKTISLFLGIDHVIAVDKAKDMKDFGRHGTSKSPEDSVGRWKSALSSQERQLFSQEFRAFFEKFGYEV
jgi:hypothetical protein